MAILVLLFIFSLATAQNKTIIPSVYSNIQYDEEGKLYFEKGGTKYYANTSEPKYNLQQLYGNPVGTDNGFTFDFGNLTGSITYGLIPYGQVEHPLPIFRFNEVLVNGETSINIKEDFQYPYDFVDWKNNGFLTIGYRLIDESGMIVYDGEVSLKGKGLTSIT